MIPTATRRERDILSAAIEAGRIILDVFGLGSLVDKIGERFGNRVRDALLFIVALAAFVVCINMIVAYGIVPVVDFIRGFGTRSALGLFDMLLRGVLIGGISGIVFQFVMRLLLKRVIARADASRAEADQLLADVRKTFEDGKARGAEYMKQAEAVIEEAERRSAELNQREREVKELADRVLKLLGENGVGPPAKGDD